MRALKSKEGRPPDFEIEEVHFERLKEATDHMEQEARMVIPGIQALFGFQFVAVLNQRFVLLTPTEQHLHWGALGLTAVAAMLCMAPAAYHRVAEPDRITRRFVTLSSRWLCWGMGALSVSTCLDFYLIGRIVFGNRILSGIAAAALFGCFAAFWIIFPMIDRKQEAR